MDSEYIKVVSNSNGHTYTIGVSLYKSNKEKWTLVPEKIKKEEKVVEDYEELSYSEIKERLTEIGVSFKGNSSKDRLIDLLKEVD